MHTYLLAELGKDTPINDLPPIQESHLKFAHQNKDDLYEIEKILNRKRGNIERSIIISSNIKMGVNRLNPVQKATYF